MRLLLSTLSIIALLGCSSSSDKDENIEDNNSQTSAQNIKNTSPSILDKGLQPPALPKI